MDLVYQKITNRKDALQPDIPKEDWGDHVAMEPKVTILKYGFWDSSWYFDSANQKVQEVGLIMNYGIHIGPWFDVLASHQSVHSADSTNAFGVKRNYELRDQVGVRIHVTP